MAKTALEIKNILEARINNLQENQKKYTRPDAHVRYGSAFNAGRNFGQMEGMSDALVLIEELLHDPTTLCEMNPIK